MPVHVKTCWYVRKDNISIQTYFCVSKKNILYLLFCSVVLKNVKQRLKARYSSLKVVSSARATELNEKRRKRLQNQVPISKKQILSFAKTCHESRQRKNWAKH